MLEKVLAGAVLAELVLKNRIALVDDRVIVSDQTLTDHPVLDIVLFDMINSARPRKLRYWINTLIFIKIQNEIVQHLIEKGILARKKKRLHLVIPYDKSQSENDSAKDILKNHLRDVVMAGEQPELSELVLLAFLYHCDLLKLVFLHRERKAANKKVKKLITNVEESQLGETLDQIVAAACGMD